MKAMRDEIDLMPRKNTWKLVDLPPKHKSIGNKWIFKIKRRQVEGWSIDKFNAHRVVKGFTQIKVIDYEKTFSHVASLASIHPVLSLVAHLDLELF